MSKKSNLNGRYSAKIHINDKNNFDEDEDKGENKFQ